MYLVFTTNWGNKDIARIFIIHTFTANTISFESERTESQKSKLTLGRPELALAETKLVHFNNRAI